MGILIFIWIFCRNFQRKYDFQIFRKSLKEFPNESLEDFPRKSMECFLQISGGNSRVISEVNVIQNIHEESLGKYL